MTELAYTGKRFLLLNRDYVADLDAYKGMECIDDFWIDALKRKLDIRKATSKGEIYVRFVNPNSRRYGGIALVHSGSIYRTKRSDRISGHFYVRWEGRRNVVKFFFHGEHVEWLVDYEGPTHWVYDRSRSGIPPKNVRDRLGRDLKVGQLVCYVSHEVARGRAATLHFGNIVKITDGGEVTCRSIALGNEVSKVTKIKHNDNITIISDDLLDKLMLAKLQTQ